MAPTTFTIPNAIARNSLQPGDFAKLMFEIRRGEEDLVVERMRVLVTARREFGYVGILDNDPREIAENDELWSGTELPFKSRHVIAIQPRDAASVALSLKGPRRRWS